MSGGNKISNNAEFQDSYTVFDVQEDLEPHFMNCTRKKV